MAVPGVTLSDVQLALVAHCENTKSRFAVTGHSHRQEEDGGCS